MKHNMMRAMLIKAEELYGYDEDDKAILKRLEQTDKEGLLKALDADSWLIWHIEHERKGEE